MMDSVLQHALDTYTTVLGSPKQGGSSSVNAAWDLSTVTSMHVRVCACVCVVVGGEAPRIL